MIYNGYNRRLERWIINHQTGRRNLTKSQLVKAYASVEEQLKREAKERQAEAGGAVRQKSDKAVIDTKKELAKIAGVSHDTIHRVEVRHYDSDDKVLKDLIETNIMQRGIGNTNPIKLAKCIVELERILGIRNGSAGKVSKDLESHNVTPKTQEDLAEQLKMSKMQLTRYKKLLDLVPELQSAVESGQISATILPSGNIFPFEKMEKQAKPSFHPLRKPI